MHLFRLIEDILEFVLGNCVGALYKVERKERFTTYNPLTRHLDGQSTIRSHGIDTAMAPSASRFLDPRGSANDQRTKVTIESYSKVDTITFVHMILYPGPICRNTIRILRATTTQVNNATWRLEVILIKCNFLSKKFSKYIVLAIMFRCIAILRFVLPTFRSRR